MEKKIILSERNHNKDDIKLHKSSVAYNRGEVSFVDETTNEIIFQARNSMHSQLLCQQNRQKHNHQALSNI